MQIVNSKSCNYTVCPPQHQHTHKNYIAGQSRKYKLYQIAFNILHFCVDFRCHSNCYFYQYQFYSNFCIFFCKFLNSLEVISHEHEHHRQSSAQHDHQLIRIHLKSHRSLVIERHHLSLDIIPHQKVITSTPPLSHTIIIIISSSAYHHPSTIKFHMYALVL